MSEAKMCYCFNCGEELGVSKFSHPLDTCGKRECDNAALEAYNAERDEAHERLDRDMGWDR